jgi:hypothetical protein
MGWQIIKQPNGKYCIFSSVVDNVTYYNCTKEQIIDIHIKQEADSIRKRVSLIIDELEDGEKPYNEFTKTFEEMLLTIEDIHGKDELEKVITLLKEIK